MVGMVVRRDEAECHRIVRRPLQLPARKNPRRIPVHEKPQQQRGMIRSRSCPPVAPAHRRQIQPVNDLDNKAGQVPLRQPLVHRWRQKVCSLTINRAEIVQRHPTQRRRKVESMRRFYLNSIENTTAGVSTKLPWFGTTRTRLGFLLNPALLLYATGGVAYGRVEESVPGASTKTPGVGWTAGAGLQYALTPQWSIGAEYLHIELDGPSANVGG